MSELVVRGLGKSFGDLPVLRGVDLAVPQGALAALLGPSGCGKTTLLRIVAGFERADRGTVALDGRVITDARSSLPPERRRVGIVPQEGALFPHLTVGGNVGFGLARRDRAARVQEVLELVGLAGLAARMPAELSGGQQQRVALARALAPQPALVLLDEPFSALDSGLRAAIRQDVRELLRAAGTTALLVTHDQQEALSMADLVAVMRDGVVVQCAPPAELYAAPSDVGVATFVGDAVVLPAVASDGAAVSALGRLPVTGQHPAGARGHVVIRPEQVVLGPAGDGVPATVLRTVFYGHDALVHLDLGGDVPTVITARAHGTPTARVADAVSVRVHGPVRFFRTA
jgi:iron(III) transport system ATP-binding protein